MAVRVTTHFVQALSRLATQVRVSAHFVQTLSKGPPTDTRVSQVRSPVLLDLNHRSFSLPGRAYQVRENLLLSQAGPEFIAATRVSQARANLLISEGGAGAYTRIPQVRSSFLIDVNTYIPPDPTQVAQTRSPVLLSDGGAEPLGKIQVRQVAVVSVQSLDYPDPFPDASDAAVSALGSLVATAVDYPEPTMPQSTVEVDQVAHQVANPVTYTDKDTPQSIVRVDQYAALTANWDEFDDPTIPKSFVQVGWLLSRAVGDAKAYYPNPAVPQSYARLNQFAEQIVVSTSYNFVQVEQLGVQSAAESGYPDPIEFGSNVRVGSFYARVAGSAPFADPTVPASNVRVGWNFSQVVQGWAADDPTMPQSAVEVDLVGVSIAQASPPEDYPDPDDILVDFRVDHLEQQTAQKVEMFDPHVDQSQARVTQYGAMIAQPDESFADPTVEASHARVYHFAAQIAHSEYYPAPDDPQSFAQVDWLFRQVVQADYSLYGVALANGPVPMISGLIPRS